MTAIGLMLWIVATVGAAPTLGPPRARHVRQVAIDEAAPHRWAVLTASGALWQTDDAGVTWRRVRRGRGDGERMAGVGDRLSDLADDEPDSGSIVERELREAISVGLAFVDGVPRRSAQRVAPPPWLPPGAQAGARVGDVALVVRHGRLRRHRPPAAVPPPADARVPSLGVFLQCLDAPPPLPRRRRGLPALAASFVVAPARASDLRGSAITAGVAFTWRPGPPSVGSDVLVVAGVPQLVRPSAVGLRSLRERQTLLEQRHIDEIVELVATRRRWVAAPAAPLRVALVRHFALAENTARLAAWLGFDCPALAPLEDP